MLSYRHGFHAGNHADVLKHSVLLAVLRYLQKKPGALYCIDSHAGTPVHKLDQGFAIKNNEHQTGIARLWAAAGDEAVPELLQHYLAQVRRLNPDGALSRYPGSSRLLLDQLREQDRLRLLELHPSELDELHAYFGGQKQTQLIAGDGFHGLHGLLPPPSRRGLVLIDPSYEVKTDYQRVYGCIRDALKRFPGGSYAIWYPQLRRNEPERLVQRLKGLAGDNWLHARLSVRRSPSEGSSMIGSGMLVINPPWSLPQELEAALPWLVEQLGQDAGATHLLESQIS